MNKHVGFQRVLLRYSLLAGGIHPAAKQPEPSLKALSKFYQVTIYTQKEESYTSKSGMNPLKNCFLLPFAVVIDVVTCHFR